MPTARPERASASESPASNGLAALLAAIMLLSAGPSILRHAESAGLAFAGWRMIVGAAAYFAVLKLRGGHLSLAAVRNSFWGGVAFGVSMALGYSAIANTSIANAQIIGALRPAVVLLVVGPLLGDRIRAMSLVWTCFAIGGVAIMVIWSGENSGNSLFGDMLALLGMLVGTCFLVFSRNARSRHDALTYSTAMTLVAGAVLLPAAAVAEGTLTPLPVPSDWPHVMLMTALPGIGHVLTTYSIGYVKLHVVSNVHLLQPVLTAVIAWFVVDEPLVAAQIIGMGVTVAALFPLARDEHLRLRR